MSLAPLDTDGFSPPIAHSPGPAPMLQWIALGLLMVDRSYQREVREKGRRNVRKIIAEFDWSKFAPVIVAPIEGGKYAIIDGQHRATAAVVVGIETVPCQVVQADRARQAAAFAAINGTVTEVSPMQIFHARVAAGDAKAVALAEICAAAGVEIMRYPVMSSELKPGQTLAAGALMRLAERVERDTLLRALQVVTETGGGNPGMLRAAVVQALCTVLDTVKAWRDEPTKLFAAMDEFDLETAWEACLSRGGTGTTADRMAVKIRDHLGRRMG